VISWEPRVVRLPTKQATDHGWKHTARWYGCAEAEEGRRIYAGWGGTRNTMPTCDYLFRFTAARAARRLARRLNAEQAARLARRLNAEQAVDAHFTTEPA
jgi:hypothetical protein